MINENLCFVAVLFQNGCAVGLIDYLGFIQPTFSRLCILRKIKNQVLYLPYFPKAESRESVRIYTVPYSQINNEFNFEYILKAFSRVEIKCSAISSQEVEKMRQEAKKNAEQWKLAREMEREKEEYRAMVNHQKYVNWWERSESENAEMGLYNGD